MLSTIYTMFPFLCIVALASLTFGSSLAYDFVWDDKIFIIGKPIYRQFDLHNIIFHPYSPANGVEYLPVRDLSYVIDYYIWGQSEFGFHLTNLLLYILSAVLLYHLVARLLVVIGTPSSDNGVSIRYSILPMCTTLLFVAHPLHCQVVAFIIQRNTLLSGLFFFSSLLLYLKHVVASTGMSRFVYWFSAFVCCLLAFFSKATSITLPVVMALILLCSARRRNLKSWFALTPFFIASILTAWLFSEIARHTGFINSNPMDFGAFSPTVKLARALQIPWFYLSKLIIPINLAPEYGTHLSSYISHLPALLSLAALFATSFLMWRLRCNHQLAVFAIGCYAITLLPVLNLLPTYPVVADRYAYLPSFGFCLLSAYFIVAVIKNKILLTSLFAFVMVLLCVLSFREVRIWRDDRTLYEAMIAREPELAMGYARLGYTLLQEWKPEEALKFFNKAAELDPMVPDYECQMGSRAMKAGNFNSAIEWFDKALMKKETHIVSLFLCGVAYTKSSDLLNASRYFSRVILSPDSDINSLKQKARFGLEKIVKPFVEQQAIEIRKQKNTPDLIHHALAGLYYKYHLFDDAFRELDTVPQLEDRFDENLMRASMYAAQGMQDKALLYYSLCLKEMPEDAKLLYGAGQTYQRQRNFTDALECYCKASRNDPGWDAPLFQQAVIYFLTGERDKALSGFKALRQHPYLKWKVAAYELKLEEL